MNKLTIARRFLLAGFVLTLVVGKTSPAVAAETPAEAVEFFEAKIRPILVGHCYECHSSAGAEQIQRSLALVQRM